MAGRDKKSFPTTYPILHNAGRSTGNNDLMMCIEMTSLGCSEKGRRASGSNILGELVYLEGAWLSHS